MQDICNKETKMTAASLSLSGLLVIEKLAWSVAVTDRKTQQKNKKLSLKKNNPFSPAPDESRQPYITSYFITCQNGKQNGKQNNKKI